MLIGILLNAVWSPACDLLWRYAERNGNPEFWAEPWNALSNLAFPLAALAIGALAQRRQVRTPATSAIIGIAALVGFGSFAFHTVPNHVTIWMDRLPIAALQLTYFWLCCRHMFGFSMRVSVAILASIMIGYFSLMPFHVLNNSLPYLPALSALLFLGCMWAERSSKEPYLIVGAGITFTLALAARTIDRDVPWRIGTHFLWHLCNGGVVYLLLRSWVLHLGGLESDVEKGGEPSGQAASSLAGGVDRIDSF